MYIFLPSWYTDQNWNLAGRPWHQAQASHFDDAVSQLRMFRHAGEETMIWLLAYAPQLEAALHRQNLYPTPFWSAFDALQGVDFTGIGVLSFEELSWPADLEWIETPFVITAFRGGERYARVELDEEGRLLFIDYHDRDKTHHRDIFDDRGFLSSRLFFAGEVPARQEFYDPQGILRFTRNLLSGRVEIAAAAAGLVSKTFYDSMAACLEELLAAKLHQTSAKDCLILAVDARQNHLVLDACPDQKLVLSFFEDRFDLSDVREVRHLLAGADLAVTDREREAKILRQDKEVKIPVRDISPFDTRLSLGCSQRSWDLKVYLPVDGLEEPYLSKALEQIFRYMQTNSKTVLIVGTQRSGQELEALRRQFAGRLARLQMEELGEERTALPDDEDREPGEEKQKPPRICFVTVRSESELIQVLEDIRLIVDVRDQPDLYLQISGISAGIPQVNYRFTRYVEHQKDGYIIPNIDHVEEALDYYLTGLSHWNEALVYCVKKAQEYTGGSLVSVWKKMLEKGEKKDG